MSSPTGLLTQIVSSLSPAAPSPRRRNRAAAGALVCAAVVIGMAFPGGASAAFSINYFKISNPSSAEPNSNYTPAGGHSFNNEFEYLSPADIDESLMDVSVKLPPGFLGNASAAPRCPVGNVSLNEGRSDCPPGSKVGMAVSAGAGFYPALPLTAENPLYNVAPEPGYPASFAFKIVCCRVLVRATLLPRTESYRVAVGVTNSSQPDPAKKTFVGSKTVFYGVPSENGSGTSDMPFLSNQVDCSETEAPWQLRIDSWNNPGLFLPDGRLDLSDPNWKTQETTTPGVTGCDDPDLVAQFLGSSVAVKPLQEGGGVVQADQPSGLSVELKFPQVNDPTDPDTVIDPSLPQTPAPKDITTVLPAGMSISPSSASGLQGCSDLASDPAGDEVHYDTTEPVTCPDASKIGTAVAISPTLALHDPQDDHIIGPEPIPGDLYLLNPHPGDLPIGGGNQDGKFRLLLQLENARYGVNIKVPGVATADKQTGQLTATFAGNPQLPASRIQVNLKSGPRAPLASPISCGAFTTNTDLVPWSTPGTPDAHPASTFNVGSGPGGSACPSSPASRPFAPAMSAGTESSKAGALSPFVLRLNRNDGEQELSSLQATLPKGLAAKFVGVPYCSDAALAAAAARAGKAEQASPSCPASRIGSVTVGAGPGPNPFNASGTAYLSGPYKGAPMSVAVITPAVAGPFDLGTVVVRNALYVDPETAQGRVVSDPFPKMLDGIPLKLRSILVRLDRPSFTLNPTNCSPLSIDATLTSTDGATAKPTNRFQASGCDKLGFKPDLKLSLKGGTARSDHPALKAVLNYPKGNYANIAKAVVSLPHSEFLAQNHIKTICTRVQFAADQCPAGSIYGYVTATTPLLEKPLEGPLYLRSSSHPLPDLVAALHGQIDVDLVGRIDSKNGGIRTTFDSVPDAPVSKFVLTMQGGKKGLLENSKNLCASVNKADVKFTAQNGRTANSKPVLTNNCKKKHSKKAKSGKKAHKSSFLSRLGF